MHHRITRPTGFIRRSRQLGWMMAAALFTLPTAAATENLVTYDIVRQSSLPSFIAEETYSGSTAALHYRRPNLSSWALAIDNDVFVGDRDQDYTYGFNLTISGSAARDLWFSLDSPLDFLDRSFGIGDLATPNAETHSIELGWFGFTPENIKTAEADPDDRPYASLVYLSSSREEVDFLEDVAWKSTLTIGILGLDLVGSFQNNIHDYLQVNRAEGWHNQISHGGELTARYAVARQQLLGTIFNNTEVKSTLQASAGYLTEISWSLSLRGGKYHTPWSAFNPELAAYGEKSTYTSNAGPILEHYFWAGAAVKVRGYNAFLQGQFRDSAVTYRANELNPVLLEIWAGYTIAFAEGYRISYVMRGHSSEVNGGTGDRSLVWGGVIVAKSF